MGKYLSLFMGIKLCITTLALLGCEGCGGVKTATSEIKSTPNKNVVTENKTSITAKDRLKNNQTTVSKQDEYLAQPTLVNLERNAFGKQISFNIDPQHEGGEATKTVWQEKVVDASFDRMNRIDQLSPTVILYRRFPKEVAKDFYYVHQADKIEFLNDDHSTAKIVDIWKNRPYQDIKNVRLTYHHFNAEAYNVLPYNKQEKKLQPNEYSLHTYVRSEGNHVIVNYHLRSLITKKEKQENYDYEYGSIIGVKHTLRIYDLKGNLKYELKDLPSVDEAVVSNNGEYMMYTFGGIGLETANNPFGTMEREGWALTRLSDQKIVYQEYTDDGKLAFNRLWLHYGYLKLSYSTPSNEIDFDYWIYFDESCKKLFTHRITKKERELLREQFNKSNKVDVQKQFIDFNFQQIPISNK